MIYVRLPTGDHGWGVVGDSLAAALCAVTPTHRLTGDEIPPVLDGPFLQNTGLYFDRPTGFTATRYVTYAVFEEDLTVRRKLREVSHGFDAIATACRWSEAVLRDAGVTEVTTIPHGIDTVRFNPARVTRQRLDDRFVVFSGGKFEFRKGQDLAVRAFKILAERHPDVVLVAAWHNPWRRFAYTMAVSPHLPLPLRHYRSFDEMLMSWLLDSGLDLRRVELVPRLPHGEMAAIYCNTDVGVFANRCEGATNLVMMEYMACGRSVVATNYSGHRDVLSHSNSIPIRAGRVLPSIRDGEPVGLWCEPDVEEIVEGLEWAYDHRENLADLGRQAARDLESWTWDRAARAFLGLLDPNSLSRPSPPHQSREAPVERT